MTSNSLYRPIDHFLQSEIIAKLATAEVPIRFSELKEDGIDNSLFMYHANKLLSRGLIEKNDAGFSLTNKGARWANYVDTSFDLTPLTPRPLVQFVIEDTADNILLAKRKGSLKDHLNDYLLPGNIYRHGLTLDENVEQILSELFRENSNLSASQLTIADVIHTASDGFSSHVICYIFLVKTSSVRAPVLEHPLFTTDWQPIHAIMNDNPTYARSEFLPLLFARLPSIKSHEVFRINIQ